MQNICTYKYSILPLARRKNTCLHEFRDAVLKGRIQGPGGRHRQHRFAGEMLHRRDLQKSRLQQGAEQVDPAWSIGLIDDGVASIVLGGGCGRRRRASGGAGSGGGGANGRGGGLAGDFVDDGRDEQVGEDLHGRVGLPRVLEPGPVEGRGLTRHHLHLGLGGGRPMRVVGAIFKAAQQRPELALLQPERVAQLVEDLEYRGSFAVAAVRAEQAVEVELKVPHLNDLDFARGH